MCAFTIWFLSYFYSTLDYFFLSLLHLNRFSTTLFLAIYVEIKDEKSVHCYTAYTVWSCIQSESRSSLLDMHLFSLFLTFWNIFSSSQCECEFESVVVVVLVVLFGLPFSPAEWFSLDVVVILKCNANMYIELYKYLASYGKYIQLTCDARMRSKRKERQYGTQSLICVSIWLRTYSNSRLVIQLCCELRFFCV